MHLVPIGRVDEAHALRPAEIGNACDEACGFDLPAQHQTRRIIRLGYAVHREAPAYAEKLAGEQADGRCRVREVIVQVRYAPLPQLTR